MSSMSESFNTTMSLLGETMGMSLTNHNEDSMNMSMQEHLEDLESFVLHVKNTDKKRQDQILRSARLA